jgi:polyphosphate kinase 2 (PPK2 family)
MDAPWARCGAAGLHRARQRADGANWGRDERSALHLAGAIGRGGCQVIYLPVDKDVQAARISHRQATAPHRAFPMNVADVDRWRKQFQVPDAAENVLSST